MMNEQVIDYQTAMDEFRRDEYEPDNPVQSSGMPDQPPMIYGYVDYLAAVKAWDKEQAGKDNINMHAGKRNPSHDPIRIGYESDT